MHGTAFLVQLLLVLAFAKFAAEGAERITMPAVVGEILAGVVVGPSVLGWVKDTDLLITLGEIGVILLLLQVGLEMDLGELGAVGKAALSVAVVGVVLPFASGAGAGLALGMITNEALFVGAALTATSVGITTRVFGDLRAWRRWKPVPCSAPPWPTTCSGSSSSSWWSAWARSGPSRCSTWPRWWASPWPSWPSRRSSDYGSFPRSSPPSDDVHARAAPSSTWPLPSPSVWPTWPS